MSFKLTIEVPDSRLMSTLRMLNGQKVYVESTGIAATLKPRAKIHNPHSRGNSRLSMTGKAAKDGSKIETAMVLFEKLEKRRGIGTVTVQDFRDHLVENELPKALSQRCVTEKFMTYL